MFRRDSMRKIKVQINSGSWHYSYSLQDVCVTLFSVILTKFSEKRSWVILSHISIHEIGILLQYQVSSHEPYPEIGDTNYKCALWTFEQLLAFKMQALCRVCIVLLQTSLSCPFRDAQSKSN